MQAISEPQKVADEPTVRLSTLGGGEGPYHLEFGNRYLQVRDDTGSLCGVKEESSASSLRLEYLGNNTSNEFRIEWEGKYVMSEGGLVRVKNGEGLVFTSKDAQTLGDWCKYGSRVRIAALDCYLGYNHQQGLVQIYPSGATDIPGEVSLLCKLKKTDM